MGFFGKLFEKKVCSICGGEIKLLGNRKLEDGNMCKTCANKLSYWFDERRHSTVEQINQQLAYREANKAEVAAFNTTRVFGEDTRIMLDEDAGKFMVVRTKKTSEIAEENPDVIAFGDVTGCVLDIDEDRRELTREGSNGERVSYNPPRYEYYYDFYIKISVRNPYFDEIRFKLNDRRVHIDYNRTTMARPMNRPMQMQSGGGVAGALGQFVGAMANAAMAGAAGAGGWNPEMDVEYAQYKQMGEEIAAVLLQSRQDARQAAADAAAPKAAVTCPYCGATTTPNASGCCEFCGGAIGG